MLQLALRPRPAYERDRFIIAPHHPDRLGRPIPRIGAIAHERFQHALTWNVFRTLELLPPAFWLRRLHARMFRACIAHAPQIVKVSLWRTLAPPPSARVHGVPDPVFVDVLIETERVVWTLVCADRIDPRFASADYLPRLLDAAQWHAGAREHYVGIIDEDGAPPGPGLVRVPRGVGRADWSALAEVLADCADAETFTDVERVLARSALEWIADSRATSPVFA